MATPFEIGLMVSGIIEVLAVDRDRVLSLLGKIVSRDMAC